MVDVLGVLSGILTIVGFFQDLAPEREVYKHRIRLGQRDPYSDGWLPQAIYYDVYGNEIAKSGWQNKWIDAGRLGEDEFGDDSLQIGQIEVHNGNNAVCFVFHEFYENDGSDPIIIMGETAQYCGAPWYYSDISVDLGDVADEFRNCAWLDQCDNGGDGCRDNAWGGYGLYNALYWRNIKKGFGDVNDVCNQLTRFEVTWKRDLLDEGGANATSAPARPSYIEKIAGDLIYTNRKIAAEACQSASSRGQSLVSTAQGLFCDMTQHVLYPICQPGMTDACFDVETDDLRVQHANSLQSRDVGAKHFNPSAVKLDADESGHVAKRSRAADSLVGNGRTHFYTAGADESDCLTADQIDGDNYTGPVTPSPAPFARISNGIIVNPAADDSQVILNCPADYSPKKRYIRGRPVA